MSLEEERARQAAANPPSAVPALETVPEAAASGAPAVPVESVAEPAQAAPVEQAVEDVVIPEAGAGEEEGDEEEELRRALALSRGQGEDDVDMDEEAEIARASKSDFWFLKYKRAATDWLVFGATVALSMKAEEEEQNK